MMFGIDAGHLARTRRIAHRRRARAARQGLTGGSSGRSQANRGREHDASLPSESEFLAMLPRAGEVVLITGPSGGGKSSLLRILRATDSPFRRWIDLPALPGAPGEVDARASQPPDLVEPHVIDCFSDQAATTEVLRMLARLGLAEAWTFLRTPSQLSDGQRWRLRLALALWCVRRDHAPGPQVMPASTSTLVIDEFAAVLDRVSAAVVACALRRAVDESASDGFADCPAGAIVATSHDDLTPALDPDVIVQCDFGRFDVARRARTRLSKGIRQDLSHPASDAGTHTAR